MRRLLLAVAALAAIPALAFAAITQVATASVTVGTTATVLTAGLNATKYARHTLVCVPEDAAGSVYVGAATVTTSTGIEVPPGQCYSTGERLAAGVTLHGIVATGTVAVRVQESY